MVRGVGFDAGNRSTTRQPRIKTMTDMSAVLSDGGILDEPHKIFRQRTGNSRSELGRGANLDTEEPRQGLVKTRETGV